MWPPFVSGSSRSGLEEPRTAPLRKPDFDYIEVPWNDRLGEDLARFARDLRPEVAVREVREDEHARSSRTGEPGCPRARRVGRLGRALGLLLAEGRLVDEHVRLLGDLEHGPGRGSVTRQDDLPPGPSRAEHLFGRDLAASGQRDRLPTLEPSEEWALRNPERRGRLDVEATRPRHLHEGVPIRDGAVRDLEDDHPVLAAVECVAGTKLHELERIREFPEDPLERAEEVDEPRRAVHGERKTPSAQGERLQHPGEAEVVVGVEVRDEHLRQLDEPDGRAEELALRPLAAVEEDALPAATDQRPRQPPARCRHGARRPQEDEVEVHASSVRGGTRVP